MLICTLSFAKAVCWEIIDLIHNNHNHNNNAQRIQNTCFSLPMREMIAGRQGIREIERETLAWLPFVIGLNKELSISAGIPGEEGERGFSGETFCCKRYK